MPESATPSGMPDEDQEQEITPLGVPAEPDDPDPDVDETDVDLPGFPGDGEADSAG
jgi:hypothetical protein